MHVKKVHLSSFKRFQDFTIDGLTKDVRLVVLAGPNGCGKSSLFDAFSFKHNQMCRRGWDGDIEYYNRESRQDSNVGNRINIKFFEDINQYAKSNFYFRSAYRQEADFRLQSLSSVGDILEVNATLRKMMLQDVSVSANYQRLASQALVGAFAGEDQEMTLGAFRQKVIGELKGAVEKLFPGLILNSIGNPLEEGTFTFEKGVSKKFQYKNLSGGEKAAFDLILDMVVKKQAYSDAIYCIDEPEIHLNTRLQRLLLDTLLDLVPTKSQLWISTHSIGMMRKAQQMWRENPNLVAFLDFGGVDPDQTCAISPSRPSRDFWERILAVALDDLAELMTPERVMICEGNPAGAVDGKNSEFDASCYNTIFAHEHPEVKFVSGGNSSSVATDRLAFAKTIPLIAKGVLVGRLIDRDDHAAADIEELKQSGVSVLSRRTIESFLYDDEILAALCRATAKEEKTEEVIQLKAKCIAESVSRGNAADDVKSAAGSIYIDLKKTLQLTSVGNDKNSFAKNTLAPLMKESTQVYKELKAIIF